MLFAFVWFLLGILLGAVAFMTAGLVVAAIAGEGVRDRIGRWYISMAMGALRDGALAVRETGALEIVRTRFAPKFEGDRAVIDGVVGDWRDPLEVKGTLAGKPFGIGLESASCYVSPLAAEAGKEGADRLESGWLGSNRTDDGEEEVTLDYSIPREPQVLDLRHAGSFLTGACKRRWGRLANKWGELSQEKFHERMSLGQSLLWIGAFAAGVGLAFAVVNYGVGDDGPSSVSLAVGGLGTAALLLAMPDGGGGDEDEGGEGEDSPGIAARLWAAVTSTTAQLVYLGAAVVTIAGAGVVIAALFWGLFSALGLALGLVIGATLPWLYVRVLMCPWFNGPIATAFFILGQLTFGAGALIRRDDGAFEWGRLREDSHGLHTRLADGTRVDIDGDRNELPTVAWARLAVAEQKTERNVGEYTVDETFRTVRPDPAGDGMVQTPKAIADGGDAGWHLDAAKLERWARGSGGADLPRNGLRKALEETGGQQQISTLVTMVGAAVLLVLGFGMTAVVMLL